MSNDGLRNPCVRHGAATRMWLVAACATCLCSCSALPQRALIGEAVLPTQPSISSESIESTGLARLGDVETVTAAVTFTPSEPRIPLSSSGTIQQAGYQQDATNSTASADLYPDEYIVDGGDRELPLHYGTFHRLGLDTEDTLAEYVDDTGERHVKATNRVAIYSPRFGSVRTVNSISSGTSVIHLARASESTRTAGLSNRDVPMHHEKLESSSGVQMRSRASGLATERRTADVSRTLVLAGHTKLLNAYEDISLVRTGQFERTDEARLANGIAAALNWTRDEFPVIAATTDASLEIYSSFKAEELVGISIEHKRKGDLRIVKLADKAVALPGEIITFTIRFDNLGDRELRDVRIVDNLTPRLEFLEETASADRPGQVTMQDNEEGSLVLQFELDEPLPGNTGGVISFQARVK